MYRRSKDRRLEDMVLGRGHSRLSAPRAMTRTPAAIKTGPAYLSLFSPLELSRF
uniref:Uncharacterized protein n=1 Tax=Arion vulgaris TaxID=1028688 RepID=A0A0B6Z4B2_9EUPU